MPPRPITPRTSAPVLLACLAMTLGAVLPVLARDAWPDNHEFLSLFERAEGFRRAFAAGDFFPLWTPFCFNGHGAPWPFFYHRLFTTLSGALSWRLGSSFHGVRLALVLVLFVGTTGMAATARRLGASPRVQGLTALLFCISPYVFFDWLVRGALAEFTALMLYPWLVWACLRLLAEGRGGLLAGLVFTLLFYAHTVMFLYALPTFAVAVGLVLVRRGWRPALAAAGLAALPVLGLCAPYALLLLRLGRHFNLDALGTFKPEQEFVRMGRYLWDSRFHWGEQWRAVTPELGPGLLASLLLLALLSRRARPRTPTSGMSPEALLLTVPAVLYAVLQTPLAAAFYRHVPLAGLLQFPWRLVGLLTVLLTLAWSRWAEESLRWEGRWRGLALGLMALPVGAGLVLAWKATHPRYGHIPRAEIEEQLARLDQPWSGGEYLPRGVSADSVPPATPFLAHAGCARLTAEPADALVQPLHFHRVALTISSDRGCTVSFSQFLTPFLTLEGLEARSVSRSDLGTLELHVPPGEHHVALRRRSFLELFDVDS